MQYSTCKRLGDTIGWITEDVEKNVDNWIVSEIVYDDEKEQKMARKVAISEYENESRRRKGKLTK